MWQSSASQAEGREFDSRPPLRPQHLMVEATILGGLSATEIRDHLSDHGVAVRHSDGPTRKRTDQVVR